MAQDQLSTAPPRRPSGVGSPPPTPEVVLDQGHPLTPEGAAQIREWLTRVLNPTPPPAGSPRTQQVFGRGWLRRLPAGADPTVEHALQQVGGQYPQAMLHSPTLTATRLLLPPNAAVRYRDDGHIAVRHDLVPQDDDDPGTWRAKQQYLKDTLKHELSHGMGLGDYSWGDNPTAYDVNHASARLREDIDLSPPQALQMHNAPLKSLVSGQLPAPRARLKGVR